MGISLGDSIETIIKKLSLPNTTFDKITFTLDYMLFGYIYLHSLSCWKNLTNKNF